VCGCLGCVTELGSVDEPATTRTFPYNLERTTGFEPATPTVANEDAQVLDEDERDKKAS
jgi:hypothetical protein